MDVTMMEVYKFPGIADLPMQVRMLFGKAWMAEHQGNIEEAEKLLDQAVEKEAELAAATPKK